MKSIDTYLCRNQKQPVIELYDMNTNEAVMSDGSKHVVYFYRDSHSEIYDFLRERNPNVQVKVKMNDGYWPLRLLVVCVIGWVIYKGLSH